jgi:hypothetical protein
VKGPDREYIYSIPKVDAYDINGQLICSIPLYEGRTKKNTVLKHLLEQDGIEFMFDAKEVYLDKYYESVPVKYNVGTDSLLKTNSRIDSLFDIPNQESIPKMPTKSTEKTNTSSNNASDTNKKVSAHKKNVKEK